MSDLHPYYHCISCNCWLSIQQVHVASGSTYCQRCYDYLLVQRIFNLEQTVRDLQNQIRRMEQTL